MKSRLVIVTALVVLSAFPLGTRADDYLDDIYYTPQVVLAQTDERDQIHKPYYNKKAMEEIIFLEDTTAAQPTDTVRAIIRR